MSKKKGKHNIKIEHLNQINQIDKRLKKKKVRENEAETSKLKSQRQTIQQKLKTNR